MTKHTHPHILTLKDQLNAGEVSRRQFLRTATLLGLSASAAYVAIGEADPLTSFARADELPKITSEPEILFPNLVSPKKSKMRGSGYESVDDVQILPSKKGQYRRKDQD